MKRYLLFGLLALTISGCAQMEQQRRQQNSAADKAWCADIGVTPGHPSYAECRVYAAQIRQQEHAAQQRALSSAGAYFSQMGQPQAAPRLRTTCVQQGVFLNCN